jgi:hypothetical protein
MREDVRKAGSLEREELRFNICGRKMEESGFNVEWLFTEKLINTRILHYLCNSV